MKRFIVWTFFFSLALAANSPPLHDISQLFTPEVILALVFLLTMPLTTLVSTLFRLEGATAGIIANVVVNALAKGITLVVSGQATLGFAAISVLLGIVLDKAFYDLLVKHKNEKIQILEARWKAARSSEELTPGGQP